MREEKQNITTLVAQHDVEKWKFMHYAYSFTAALSSKLLHTGGGYTFIISIFCGVCANRRGASRLGAQSTLQHLEPTCVLS